MSEFDDEIYNVKLLLYSTDNNTITTSVLILRVYKSRGEEEEVIEAREARRANEPSRIRKKTNSEDPSVSNDSRKRRRRSCTAGQPH